MASEPTRAFTLPEEDTRFLNDQYPEWETVISGEMRWVLLPNIPLPPGYNHDSATLAIQIPASYPPGKLDMVYVSPSLARIDGKKINNLINNNQSIRGVGFQRWSRHYDWDIERNNLESHIMQMVKAIKVEVLR